MQPHSLLPSFHIANFAILHASVKKKKPSLREVCYAHTHTYTCIYVYTHLYYRVILFLPSFLFFGAAVFICCAFPRARWSTVFSGGGKETKIVYFRSTKKENIFCRTTVPFTSTQKASSELLF
ncbi:hypothetical protein, unlikely [Trypanosoma congolense IL3000]|uniref:Uncharacterized protein n=1 Tax=Trypanosoma congolense (strain IL3000) TaxID=1068625 RepID=F9W3D9_TRYCI|nr:hypothetical protein, unlikely [Trypanosoma congolense IL3000]